MELCYLLSLLPRNSHPLTHSPSQTPILLNMAAFWLSTNSPPISPSPTPPTWIPTRFLLTQGHALTCVFPPASTSRLVVASVAELGKQEKREEMRLETPWAKSSWRDAVR